MIYDCRVYSPSGDLKEVVSGEILDKKFWDEILKDPEAPKLKNPKRANKKVTTATRQLVKRTADLLREPHPDGHKGWTAKEVLVEIESTTKTDRMRDILNSMHKPQYGGYRVKRQIRGDKFYEYWIESRGEYD